MASLYQKILVPLDGSETAAAGLGQAQRLAKDQGATLCLLHVVHDYLEQDGLRGTVRSAKRSSKP